MKQLLTVLKFEFLNYAKNKAFIIITLGVIFIIGAFLSFPRVTSLMENNKGKEADSAKGIIAIKNSLTNGTSDIKGFFTNKITDKEFIISDESEENLKKDVDKGKYKGAVIIETPEKYKYITKDIGVNDQTSKVVSSVLTEKYQVEEMKKLGIKDSDAKGIVKTNIEGEVILTGKNQMDSFMYTYIMIFALYMAIILYGQLVATSVASEKSTRAMEVLITSAKPTNLIFGKVFGSGLAGLVQIAAIFGSSIVFYNINKGLWGDNYLVKSIFDMPLNTFFYALLFFVLGYFIYTFIYGALGSLVTRTEDIGTATTPITITFMASFFIVFYSMGKGSIDSKLMVVLSYIPLTSPMAMFTRITMGNVQVIEIIISVLILIASIISVGYISAGIYKKGVLIYGKAPKLSSLLKIKN